MLADIAGEFRFSLDDLGRLTQDQITFWWLQAYRRDPKRVFRGIADPKVLADLELALSIPKS